LAAGLERRRAGASRVDTSLHRTAGGSALNVVVAARRAAAREAARTAKSFSARLRGRTRIFRRAARTRSTREQRAGGNQCNADPTSHVSHLWKRFHSCAARASRGNLRSCATRLRGPFVNVLSSASSAPGPSGVSIWASARPCPILMPESRIIRPSRGAGGRAAARRGC
jgi:hypothetical protein